ncbi:aminopeptidase P family protein [Afifella sp. IM 167]|uniref:aminopeptidase P family protein n=1 Tax=Afifella sp. IM 167 TaxID=2033586 RepID=UPI001CCA0A47|nr:aminopeptidase P family protein [Afifella sp. IM 167]MBZ8135207.1 X-Pro aminopeptidase [Afifella sp. IM 167]
MFQHFEHTGDASRSAERLAALRAHLREQGLSGFIVPRSDEHQSEYVPPSAERLAWLTGFTGSAGTAIVLEEEAALFIDGRYTVQAANQVDRAAFTPVSIHETLPSDWLAEHARKGARIGFDPWLVTRGQRKSFEKKLQRVGAELVPLAENPLDAVWGDRPAPPTGAVRLQPEEFAGKSAADKIGEIGARLAEKDVDAAILADPASIAWLFNIRGSDVPHTPLALSFAIARKDGTPELFIDGRKLSNTVRDSLASVASLREPGAFDAALRSFAEGEKVLYDAQGAAEAIALAIEAGGAQVVEGSDPVLLAKAKKNAAEVAGSRAAHMRDGVAVARFLAWLGGQAPGSLTEIDAARQLETIRSETAEAEGSKLEDISFDSISSTGPNGAINHYRVTERTNRKLEEAELYLIDSGGQYRDGTTDITRTILVGNAPADRLTLFRDRYTRVLKGHIALAMARFPKGTSGAQLDALARVSLWAAGLDFDHGTGHGVGAFLSVHEGPQRIAKTGHSALEPGMIVSNEPGYYRPGDFGIRLENLLIVREGEVPPGGDREMLSFETVTLAPFERRLIDTALLTPGEIAWLDCYHTRVRGSLSFFPGFSDEERQWLADACRPIVG